MVQCEERKQRLKMVVTCSHAFPNVTKSWDDCYIRVPMWPMYGLCAPFSSTIGHDNKGLAGVI